MKKGINNEFMILMIVIPICIFLGVGIANRSEGTWSNYSINSTARNGYSIIYEALQRLGMDVKGANIPISQMDEEVCQILVESETFEESDVLEEWVEAGGLLVYIEKDRETEVEVSYIGEGTWIQIGSSKQLTNWYLLEDTEVAYELYQALASYAEGKEIIFNEYYMHSKDAPNLWDVTPIFLKVTLIELVLWMVLYFWHAGKRFGKVVNLVEEVERTENEYIYAVANLYKKANAWELTLSSYYRELMQKINALTRREENLVEAWEKEQLPDLEMAKKVNQYMEKLYGARFHQLTNRMDIERSFESNPNLGSKRKKHNKKEVKQILSMMEHLMKTIDQRREQYWKL